MLLKLLKPCPLANIARLEMDKQDFQGSWEDHEAVSFFPNIDNPAVEVAATDDDRFIATRADGTEVKNPETEDIYFETREQAKAEYHRQEVLRAHNEGKTVPEAVAKEYPETKQLGLFGKKKGLPPGIAPTPIFKEGDRVSFTGVKGEKLTGTIEGGVREGKADINVDQVATIKGRVPIGRVEVGVSTNKLTKIAEAASPSAPITVIESPGVVIRNITQAIAEDVGAMKPNGARSWNGANEQHRQGLEYIKRLERLWDANPGWNIGKVIAETRISDENLTKRFAEVARQAAGLQGPQTEKASPYGYVAGIVKAYLSKGVSFNSQRLYALANAAFGGTQAEGKYTPKDAYDAMELGVNQFIRSKPELYDPHAANPAQVITDLEELVSNLPTQTKRTGEADEFQQFSTPPPLAYAVSWVANIGPNDVVLEPSAGVGGIAVFAHNAGAKEVIANELSPRRANLLRELGVDQVFTENAEQLNNILPKEIQPTVVVMNPPFSSTAGRMFGKRSSQIGAAHIEQALKRLEPGGRLVAIVGRGMAADKPTFATWWNKIKKEYNVLANIGISGKNYAKYGTTFDNQILVIDKTGLTTQEPVTGAAEKIEDLIPLLEGVKNERTFPELAGGRETQSTAPEPAGEAGITQHPGIAEPGAPVSPAAPAMGPGEWEGEVGRTPAPPGNVEGELGGHEHLAPDAGHGSVRAEPGGRPGEPGPAGASEPGEVGGEPGGPTGQPDNRGGNVPGPDGEGVRLETKEVSKAKGELTDSLYEIYHPQRLKIPGAQPHPGYLVQSAAMAAVDPPVPTYQPHLPKELIDTGKLSEAQLESVVYAGQAHQDILPNGQRRGFFIGDGTGVGKGREVAGIIYDNFNQGRKKAVWISEKSGLFKDARRDIGGVGWDPNLVFELGKIKADAAVKNSQGVLFTTYDTLKSTAKLPKGEEGQGKRRLDQLIEWLGKDFDGTIVFDEAHNMANARQVKGARGQKKPSMKALAGMELQDQLPKARIVYVSATGATEVGNLAYAQRLGLWGEGTPFPNREEFINEIEGGGVAAMELVARDLKAMGQYIARSLAFDTPGHPDQTVTYERMIHKLSDPQVEVYNELARAWQLVLQNIHEALKETGASGDFRSNAAAHSLFWGSHQRFFNQIITSMQMPSVVEAIHKDLEAGNAVLVQLTNTNEAAQERALGRQSEEADLDGLDLTPREALMQYVEHAFPTTQFEPYLDEEGVERWRPVFDSNGNPVQNAEAVRMKEELLEKLGAVRVPDGPLEILLNAFGPEKVAEATGRKRRLVKQDGETILEKRGRARVEADIAAFLDDKKPILAFSDMAGTGRSFNASYEFKNQRKRIHYGVQLGWRADIAVQKMGRSHRSNQRSAPHYVLVSTDLDGQKRFLSSIARRLDQLGALTKGQRQTGSTGLFQAKDNLESNHARDALRQFYSDLAHGEIPGMDLGTFQEQTGLRLLDKDGNLLQDLPPITQFLNRLLSMEVHNQNKTFTAFQERVEKAAEVATRRGTLDVGMETLRPEPGGRIEKVNEQLVHTEPRTGAETKYVEVNEINPTKIRSFADTGIIGGSDPSYYRNVHSNRIWVRERRSWNETQPNGEVTRNWTIYGPLSRSWQDVPDTAFFDKSKWEQVPGKDAKKLWEAEIAKAPKEETRRHHLITGTILPIWDRLKGNTRVIRTQTQEGERFIGRRVPEHGIDQVLQNLGAKGTGVETRFTPQQVHENVLDKNYVVTLANGWEIKRSRVSGEERIELMGPDYVHLNELQRAGAFTERIQWNTRFFIPTDASGPGVIEKIIKHRPIVSAVPRASSQGAAKYKIARAFGLRTPSTAISQARQGLAAQYGVAPEMLKYIGDWEPEPGIQGLHLFNIMDPEHPQFRSTAAWPMAEDTGPPISQEVSKEDIQKAFGPGAQVTQSLLIPNLYEVTLPNGIKILVRQNAEIKIKPESLEAYGKTKLEPGQYVAGEWNSLSGANVISLAKGEGAETLHHEVFHAAMELALSKRERQAILKEYKSEEAAAQAYQTWSPQEKPDTLFQKILDFFQRIVEVLRPTAAGTFGKIKSAEVWGRGAKGQKESAAKYSIRSAEAESRLQAYQDKMMAPEVKEESAWQRFKDKVLLRGDTKQEAADTLKGWYDEIVDRYAPFERAQAKAVKAGGLIPTGEMPTYTLAFWRGQEGWVSQAVMKNGVYQETKEGGRFTGDNRKVGESLNKRLDPIRDLAEARGEKPETVMNDLFSRFMVAQRDLELAGETGVRGTEEIKGVNPEESRQVLADLKQVYGADYRVLEQVAGKLEADGNFTPGSIREWSDQAILQRLEQGGLITPELHQEIKAKNQFYLPFRRLMDQVNEYVNTYARALGVKGKAIETIKGSEKQILDPLQMLMDLVAKANYAYARNRVLDSVAKLGQFDPEIYEVKGKLVPGLEKSGTSPLLGLPTKEKTWAWSQLPPEAGTVPYYRDGKLRWLKLPPDMFKATQNMMPQDIGLLLSWAKKPADLLRAGAVTTPEFGLVTNPIRDIIQSWVFSRFGFSPLKWFRDLGLLVSKNPATLELRNQAEAGGGFMATLAQSMLEPEKITAKDITGEKKGMWYAAHPVQALRHVSAYLENMTRFSIYKQALEKGLTHAEAINEMRRTTLDFRRTGGHPVVRYLNMIIPFFNANIQGADKLFSELAGPNKYAVMRRLALLTAGSIGLWGLAHQDDRYKELENWERNYFWHIPLGENGPMIRLPKPFEAGILFGSVPERILDQLVDKNVGGIKSALKTAFDALTPEFIPAFARGLIEGRSNYNWFLERPIEDASLRDLPVELRSKPWTSELAKAVSKYVGPIVSPVMELSPVKVEHMVRTMSGGLGANFFLPGADVLLRKAGVLEDIPQPEQDWIQNVWGARALFSKPPVGYRAKSVNDFFENYQKIIQADQGWKNLWNSGSMDQLDDFLKANPEAMFARVVRKQMAELGKIKKERSAIYLGKTLDPEQKRTKLDALDERVVQLVKAGNALMDPEVAGVVGMPSRFKQDALGQRKAMDLDSYYKFIVESVGDAYDGIQKEIPRLLRMDDASRQRFLIKSIRQAREEYQPLLKKPEDVTKPYRFQNLLDKPTRKERAGWQQMFGARKIPPGAASGYRIKEEKEARP